MRVPLTAPRLSARPQQLLRLQEELGVAFRKGLSSESLMLTSPPPSGLFTHASGGTRNHGLGCQVSLKCQLLRVGASLDFRSPGCLSLKEAYEVESLSLTHSCVSGPYLELFRFGFFSLHPISCSLYTLRKDT